MQQTQTLNRPALRPVVQPIITHENGADDLVAARAALAEARSVIDAQEERIRHLEDMALTDELTGLLNRRGFILALRRELAFARRDKGAQGMLIMADIDDFKKVNDVWGHAAGDDYLKAAAAALVSCVRDHDFVARPGGDEFAVILTRIDKRNGLARLREIERIFHSRSANWRGHALPLRASFGMSPYMGDSAAEDIMAIADLRLYAAKGQRHEHSPII
jgi:diguanylate cyclase (GGDEF)-like protein